MKQKILLAIFSCAVWMLAQANAQEQDDTSEPDAIELSDAEKDRACGAMKDMVQTKIVPKPEPEAGQALVYVLRPTTYGGGHQTKLAMDGEFMGSNRGNNYFYFSASPGEHLFCSKSENRSFLKLMLEPDKTYFLQQKISIGVFVHPRNKLVVMPDEEGREKLKGLKPSSGPSNDCDDAVDVNYSVKKDKKQHPLASHQAGQATVYVLRTSGIVGSNYQTKLAMDGTWLGANVGGGYFFFATPPGEHVFCSKYRSVVDMLPVELEADKTYYLQQKFTTGNPSTLTLLSTEEGEELLGKSHFSVITEKEGKK